MKITRIRKVAVSMFAIMALAGAGAGAVSAASPTPSTPDNGIEATTTEAPGTGVEVGGVAGYADTNGVDVNTQQDGNF